MISFNTEFYYITSIQNCTIYTVYSVTVGTCEEKEEGQADLEGFNSLVWKTFLFLKAVVEHNKLLCT